MTGQQTVKELVREFRAGGGFYDADAVAFVAGKLGAEPTRDLSRECYNAKTYLSDEDALAVLNQYRAEGFKRVEDAFIRPDTRYEVRRATVYVGRIIPDYGNPIEGRAVSTDTGVMFLPKGKRTHGHRLGPWDLVRKVEQEGKG